MIDLDKRKAIFCLHEGGMGVRQIARRLHVSRNAVRSIIRDRGEMPALVRQTKIELDPELLERLYADCDGFIQRVQEKLVEEEKIDVKYSTLTRRLRDLGIHRRKKSRCDRVPDVPGEEMQHDTSPYTVLIGDNRVKVVASVLYLRYSKLRYLKFYRRFNRFAMKCFLHEALTHWGYAARFCIIDNTNLARLRGTGKDAVMVPEMEAFSRQYGFNFQCHAIRHSNRKAGNERAFWTVETNFFPGRNFSTIEDMNEQAFDWSTVRLYHRPIAKTGLIPAKAFEYERAFLTRVPEHIPAPYIRLERMTDQYGFAAVNGNYFWVPGTGRGDVHVLQYGDRLKICRGREVLIEYQTPPDAVRNEWFSPVGQPKPRYRPTNRKKPTAEEERRLRAVDEVVGDWMDFALLPRGLARHRAIRDLYRLSKQMTAPLFTKSVARALKYRIRAVEVIRRIAFMYLHEGAETMPEADVDESFLERDAYLEGRLTDEPSFSAWDQMLAKNDDDDGGDDDDGDHKSDGQDHG
jgi:transposase